MRGDYFPQVTYTLSGEVACNVFHLPFARHPASETSSTAYKGAEPIKNQTCLKYVFGRQCQSGKGLNLLCSA